MTWKKISIWVGAGIIALMASAVLMLAALVKQSPSFRQGLLAKAESSIYENTGAHVAVREFSLNFFPLNLDLHGVVVRGNEPEFGEPLLRADHVRAGIDVRSLHGRRWRLRDLVLDHPVVHLFINQAGSVNLPQPQGNGRSKNHIFDITAREVKLRGAEVDCNQRAILFEAELRNLHSSADFDPGTNGYRGLVNYTEGKVKYDHYDPVVHSLNASFNAGPARFTADRLVLVAGKSRLSLEGSLENYGNPSVQVTYDANVATNDVAPFVGGASLPKGAVHLDGSLGYRRDPLRPTVETVSLSGTISSSTLAVATRFLQAEVRDFGARYKLAAGNAEVENIHAEIFAGKMTGSLSIRDLAGASTAKVRARLKDASLEEFQAEDRRRASPDARLSGRISADIEASWNKALQDLAARANLTLTGTLGSNSGVPLHAAIHADYAAANQQFTLRQTYLRTAQTSITLDGSVSEQSQLQVSLRSGNLHEVELLAENLKLPRSGSPLQSLDLYGTGSFTGSVSGPAREPRLKGQLEAADLRVSGTRWRLLRTDVDASPAWLSFSNASLEAGSQAPEKPQHPEPRAEPTASSQEQISQSRNLATVK